MKLLKLLIFYKLPNQIKRQMDIFRRIGTQKKKFKLQFFMGRLKFSAYRQGKVYIVIKRGDRKVKSEQKLQMSEDCKLNFNKQILEMEITLFFDEKQNKYQQKPGQMNIVLIDQKNSKVLLGVVPFDVAQYANVGQQSIKEKKKMEQTPKKLEGLIQFNVFIKYIGEGSQSSSMDKISGFFFGKPKQETQEAKEKEKQDQKKKKTKKVDKSEDTDSLPTDERPVQKDKNKQKTTTKSQLKKQKGKQKEQEGIQPKVPKNYVTAGKIKNQDSYLTSDNDQSNSKNNFYFDQPQTDRQPGRDVKNNTKKRSSSMQKIKKTVNFSQTKNTQPKKKKLNQSSGSEGSQNEDIQTSQVQPVDKNTIFKKYKQNTSIDLPKDKQKSQNKIQTKGESSESQKSKPKKAKNNQFYQNQTLPNKPPLSNKLSQNQTQKLLQQNESLKSRLQQSQITVKQLKKQVTSCKKQISQLKEQVQQYQEQIRQKQEQLLKQRDTISHIQTNFANENQNQKGSVEFYQSEIKKLEKDKNQLIVENSRLKEKYKQDFRKYQQILSEKQEKQSDLNEMGRAEIQRLKQECSSYRQKIQKLSKEKDDKTAQSNKQRNENKVLQGEVTDLKSSLSKMKLKICTLLNEALSKNEDSTIELLMDLNRE